MCKHSRCWHTQRPPGLLFCFLIQASKVRSGLDPMFKNCFCWGISQHSCRNLSSPNNASIVQYKIVCATHSLCLVLILNTSLYSTFRKDGGNLTAGRIAIQSLCAPQCRYFEKVSIYFYNIHWLVTVVCGKFETKLCFLFSIQFGCSCNWSHLIYTLQDWDMVSFIRSLKAMVRSSNSVAVITFPSTVLSNSFCKRWQHLADTLLSIKAIPGKLGLLKFIFQ